MCVCVCVYVSRLSLFYTEIEIRNPSAAPKKEKRLYIFRSDKIQALYL